jgi:hypothetical protein
MPRCTGNVMRVGVGAAPLTVPPSGDRGTQLTSRGPLSASGGGAPDCRNPVMLSRCARNAQTGSMT